MSTTPAETSAPATPESGQSTTGVTADDFFKYVPESVLTDADVAGNIHTLSYLQLEQIRLLRSIRC
jgi:hypothetical protein